MKIVQRPTSIEMYNFLNTMLVDSNNRVINQGNVVDNTDTFVSKMFTPNLKVSDVTKNLLENLGLICVKDTNINLDKDSTSYWLLTSDLRQKDYKVYKLFKSVLADIYSYTYAVSDNPYFMKYTNKKDLDNTINNVTYLIDYLSSNNGNTAIMKDLYNISACLGVLKNQLDLIKNMADKGESIDNA